MKELPLGEAGRDALRVVFDRTVKLEFHGATLSSDAGLLPYRDLDDAEQLTESATSELLRFRTGRNIQHGMTGRAPFPGYPRRGATGQATMCYCMGDRQDQLDVPGLNGRQPPCKVGADVP